jgi:hypothetical protein
MSQIGPGMKRSREHPADNLVQSQIKELSSFYVPALFPFFPFFPYCWYYLGTP